MALHFSLVSNLKGFGKPVVHAIERGLTGVYRDGKPYGPNMAEVRECLPANYRKAFDRAGGAWWFISGQEERASYMTLRGYRGKYLGTIYANAVELAPNNPPERYIVETQRRDGSWTNSIHAPIHTDPAAAQALADQMSANESPLNPSRAVVYDPAYHVTFTDTDTLLKHCRR